MALMNKYPEGSDISILNATYHYPTKNPDTGKYTPDFMAVIFKDNVTGKKHHEIVYEPRYRFFQANDDVEIRHNMFYIDKEKVHPVECKYSDVTKTIAELTGNLDFFYENIKAGNRRGNRALHTIPTIFSSDQHIEDHYRARFAQDYTNKVITVTKGYFDIEVDGRYARGDFPEYGECPINAVSYIDDKTNTVNVFLLRDIYGENPLIAQFEQNFKDQQSASALFAELQQFVIYNVGGLENAQKFHVDNLNFQVMFYDDEIQLLTELFRLINMNSPDFMLAWNMAFDVPYIIERIYRLGYDPAIIMSCPDFEEKFASYYIDDLHRNEYELRGDYYDIASKTVYLDQLIQFASRRKGQAAFPNFKLDTAADIITKGAVRKLDYSHITTQLSELPYLDYKTFVFYNIMDTIAQRCIEETTKDVDYIYSVASMNDTRYSKGHRQTVYLANRSRKFFYNMGYVMGNNCNTGDSVPYPGAIVGDPTHNSDYGKVKDRDQIYNIMDNSDDFDFKSLYPSITREHNMAPDTIIGKIIIDDPVHKYENPYYNDQYDRGGQFIEDICTDNPLEFGKRWLHLAGYRELMEDIEEYFNMNIPLNAPQMYADNGNIRPFITRPNAPSDLLMKPFGYLEEGEMVKPFFTYDVSKIEMIESFVR